MTIQKEDFIKHLFSLGGDDHLISNKEIAASLQISSASVTEMLGKLEKEGLALYTPYKGSCLSEKGIRIATSLIRSHRLWEVFLTKHLGYGWEDIHEVAEKLEHATDEDLAMRLESFLGYPEHCPHGDSIPPHNGILSMQNGYFSLATADKHIAVVIRKVQQEKNLLEYLAVQNLHLGAQLTILEKKPYEGELLLRLDARTLSVSYKAASKIFVERQET
jgi:DtxR family Mn-dependent transcriptional regulator